MVVAHGLALVACAIVIGLVVAAGLAHVLRNLLFGVSSMDPATFVSVPMLLTGMATFALYVPAARAARVDPMRALRQE